MNKDLLRAAGFHREIDKVEAGLCPTCSAKISLSTFRDDLSREESKISGMCQTCQDEVFKDEY